MRLPLPPDDAAPGDSEQSRKLPDLDAIDWSLSNSLSALDWQPELDSALDAIDSSLPVKRRRATDPPGTSFPRPELSALAATPDLIEALATRVAEKLKALQPPPPPAAPAMKPGAVVSIRFRWPLFAFGSVRYQRQVRARA
jgi:hypothetical protein